MSMNLSNSTVWSGPSSNSIGSPFTVIWLTLYPSSGVAIIFFVLSSPYSTSSYGVSFSPEIAPPSPSTLVVTCTCFTL